MLALSLEIVGDTLFSADLQGSAPELVAAVITALDHVIARSRNPVWPPAWLPTAANRAFKAAVATLDDAVARLVDARRAGPPQPDLLQMLLDARDDDGRPMDPTQLRDELVTLLVAGHETVASALTWAWALLAQHPAAADRVAAEAATGTLDPRTLPYTAAVFDEALRLYPPAWLITRRADEDDALGDVPVPAGSLVIISPYVAHRRPARWPEPEAFRPERFLEAATPRFAYLPFGAGPRLCIGQAFARLEGTLILAALARRLKLDLTPDGVPPVEALVTLRPHGGLKLRLSARATEPVAARS
jgi:cytochrome P450